MVVSGPGEGGGQILARGVDLNALTVTACHLSLRLTLRVTSEMSKAANLLTRWSLCTHKKLISAILILSFSTSAVTGTPVMEATSLLFSSRIPTSHSGL